ncbi:MAG: hypothetical protein WCF33_11515 [Pseudonocardiaceae bacterium]
MRHDKCRDIEAAEAHIRALLVQAISGTTFQLRGIRSFNTDTDHQVSVVAELTAEQRNDSQLEQAVSRLSLEPAVTWTVATDLDNVTDYPPKAIRSDPPASGTPLC